MSAWGAFWIAQLRPLLVVWLLLTMPMVCHHETAEFVLGSLAALTGSQHAAHAAHGAGHGHAHVHASTPAASEVDSAPAAESRALPASDDGTPRWCAHQPTSRGSFIPEGTGTVALRQLDTPTPRLILSDSLTFAPVDRPTGRSHPPPSPPPRLAL